MKQLCGCACLISHEVCPTLCNPMDCSPPGSSAHGILQAGILEWGAISSSRESSQPRDQAQVSCAAALAGSLPLGHQGSPHVLIASLLFNPNNKSPANHYVWSRYYRFCSSCIPREPGLEEETAQILRLQGFCWWTAPLRALDMNRVHSSPHTEAQQ